MIPLNKPGKIKAYDGGSDFIANHFPHRQAYFVSTASDALNAIYKKLYAECGPLRVGVSPLTCFQAIYPIVLNGHTPVFIDVNPATFNLDLSRLVARDDIQALEVIHLGGNPNEMDAIVDYVNDRNIPLIEDCAQALGSKYDDKYLGNFGDYAAFSLIKNLHVPSGGLTLSKTDLSDCLDDALAMGTMLRIYRKLKISLESRTNPYRYNVWNMLYGGLLGLKGSSDKHISASIAQLGVGDVREIELRLGSYEALLAMRLRVAEKIISGFDPSRTCAQAVPDKGFTNRNRILLRLHDKGAKEVIAALRRSGIAANNLTQNYRCGFQPHVSLDSVLGKYYQKGELEVYDSIFPQMIAVPSSPFLTDKEIAYINLQLDKIVAS